MKYWVMLLPKRGTGLPVRGGASCKSPLVSHHLTRHLSPHVVSSAWMNERRNKKTKHTKDGRKYTCNTHICGLNMHSRNTGKNLKVIFTVIPGGPISLLSYFLTATTPHNLLEGSWQDRNRATSSRISIWKPPSVKIKLARMWQSSETRRWNKDVTRFTYKKKGTWFLNPFGEEL